MDKGICIKFYGIMHWTLAYTTACSTSCSHSLNGSNKFSTKLGSGCWATGAPQKLGGPRTPYHLRTQNSVTATEM